MKSKRAEKEITEYINMCNDYGTNFAVTHIPITICEQCIKIAEEDRDAKAIEAFKQWFKYQSGNQPMEHTVNKFVELMNE